MTLPRSKYVHDGEPGDYHCFCRCVRRAFLCGSDPVTHRDFSHRKAWIVDRLHFLSDIFAIDVCAFSVMMNHYHTILRLRPDLAAAWSDRDVATRWLKLSSRQDRRPLDDQISDLLLRPQRIAQLRRRLSNLSWFMAKLNEFIARAANKEDHVKGRFWESRFQCQPLLDLAAILACMIYVDLNPIRAGIAPTPEQSDFTSIQQRIRAWHQDAVASGTIPNTTSPAFPDKNITKREDASDPSSPTPTPSSCWLCPIQSDSHRRGILPMTEADYFDLVDKSGRLLRSDKRGAIDPDLAPILLRLGANPQTWHDTISHFQSRFRLAAGLVSSLRTFALRINQRWITGLTSARTAFASSPP